MVMTEESHSDHKYNAYTLKIENKIYLRKKLETKSGQHQKFKNLIKKVSGKWIKKTKLPKTKKRIKYVNN